MKAISLWQPWASLWLTGRKTHETRDWATYHRGPLLVHAAKHCERDLAPELAALLEREFGAGWAALLPAGALLGVVHIVACERIGEHPLRIAAGADDIICGDWTAGRFAWRRGSFRSFPPVPYRGRQGIFAVPDEHVPGLAA